MSEEKSEQIIPLTDTIGKAIEEQRKKERYWRNRLIELLSNKELLQNIQDSLASNLRNNADSIISNLREIEEAQREIAIYEYYGD